MAKKIGDLCAPAGKYKDPETGEDKTRWKNHGVVIETDNGLRIKLESLPLGQHGEEGIWFSVFESQQQERQQRPHPNSGGGFRDKPASKPSPEQDNIPF